MKSFIRWSAVICLVVLESGCGRPQRRQPANPKAVQVPPTTVPAAVPKTPEKPEEKESSPEEIQKVEITPVPLPAEEATKEKISETVSPSPEPKEPVAQVKPKPVEEEVKEEVKEETAVSWKKITPEHHGIRVQINAPQGGEEKARGMLVYLHGDLAEDISPWWDRLARIAQKNDLILVAPTSPTNYKFKNGTGPTWWKYGDSNNHKFTVLLNYLIAKYGADSNRMLFTGQSGGSTFLGSWIKHYASGFQGGALLACGGNVSTKLAPRITSELKEKFAIKIVSTDKDKLYNQSQVLADRYRKLGLKVDYHAYKGRGHCQFGDPFEDLLEDHISESLVGS